MCPHPFLDELEGPLVLGDLEQHHGSSLVRGEATHLPDHVPHKLGVFGETAAAAAVPRLAHVLGHLVTLVEAHGHGVARAMAVVPQWLLRRKATFKFLKILVVKHSGREKMYTCLFFTEVLEIR